MDELNSLICSLEMEDLNMAASCANNMSGVKNVYIAFKSDIATFPKLPNVRAKYEDFAVLEGAITMKGEKRFYHIYCSRDLGELKYTLQGPTGARSMKATLEIYHPGFKAKLLGLVSSTMNSELVILARLNNGDVHLLGDKNRGVEYGDNAELSSGKAVTDNNGGTLNFVFDTPTAQIYKGDNIDAITGTSTQAGG
jgi:hypothetical protein